MYKVGDKVVYPHHGAGTVVKKETREVLGEKREYLTIKILHNDMTVNVPSDNAERVGLRKVIDEQMVSKVLKALTGSGTTMPKNWNRRFKHNRDKMKTGDIFELAEVVRNLSLRDHEKGLSTGEKQMFVKAKKILASELMYAKDMDEDEAAEWLDGVLAAAARRRRAPPRSRPPPSSLSVWAVLAAAGRGERLGSDRPKAFARLGRTAAARREPRAARGLGLDRADRDRGAARVGGAVDPRRRGDRRGKVSSVVTGGETRSESVRLALEEVPEDAAVVLVHDAARPLLPEDVIERVLAPLAEGWDGAVPALPVAGHGQAGRRRPGRRDAAARRARRRADAAGVRRRRAARARLPATCRARATARRSSRPAAAGSRSSRATRGC